MQKNIRIVSVFVLGMVILSLLSAAYPRELRANEARAKLAPASPGTRYYGNRVAILMYHHVMEKPSQADIISAAQFEKQMSLLRSEGFHVISLDQYRDFLLYGKSVPDNAVLITFDDGYDSFYTLAYPILKKYGYPAVNFVIVSKIDVPGQNIPKLRWDDMREMQKYGMAFMDHTYGLHGLGEVNATGLKSPRTMGRLYLKQEHRRETAAQYEERLRTDFASAESTLQRELGNTYSAFSFPYGTYNQRLLRVLEELGIQLSFSIDLHKGSRAVNVAKRINMGRSDVSPKTFIERLKRSGRLLPSERGVLLRR